MQSDVTPPTDGIIVFTDGASKGNGSRHSRAGCAAIFPYHPELNITYTLPVGSTNNRAEYTAIQLALEQTNKDDSTKRKTLYIYTDSQLLVDSMTKWIGSWKRNGWKKRDGKPVLNQDILKRIDELSQIRRVVYKHVLAHTGRDDWQSVWNQKADDAANEACNCGGGSRGTNASNANHDSHTKTHAYSSWTSTTY